MSFLDRKAVYVTSADKLPAEEHYAIITSSSHPDGYDGYSDHIEYKAFFDRAEWEDEVAELMAPRYGQRSFRAMHVVPANIKVSVEVKTP